MTDQRTIAYFSMEIGLEARMPTYAGGLGILAGDTIRSAADLEVPMVGVTLLHRRGYFRQRLDASGSQSEEPEDWKVEDFLDEMPQRAAVTLEERVVELRCWKHDVQGVSGYRVPVYFLDACLPGNSDSDRALTDSLYGGDQQYRLCQEIVLGIGGVRMLRALGYTSIERFHMNEGHSSFLTLELLDEEANRAGRRSVTRSDIEAVRNKCVFTTHTPVPAGHDQFPIDLVRRLIGAREDFFDMKDMFSVDLARHVLRHDDRFSEVKGTLSSVNLTYLALNLSRYVNGVAKRHGEVSSLVFAPHAIDSITNGVHASTWASRPFQELFDWHIPGWREDNFSLRYAVSIPQQEVWEAHVRAKRLLIDHMNGEANVGMGVDVFTIGFARRATAYKRADLLFHDTARLSKIASGAGAFQVIYAGKAHPQDRAGKELIKRIFQFKEAIGHDVKIAYLENYDMEVAKLITAGVDLWLNTPQQPLEASGTSGMKAALNGVPSLSILDGWWIEGHIEGVTGWSIGEREQGPWGSGDDAKDAASLYDKLERCILPLFYSDRRRFIDVMINSIALNGSFFNTQRMVLQYALKAYHSGLAQL